GGFPGDARWRVRAGWRNPRERLWFRAWRTCLALSTAMGMSLSDRVTESAAARRAEAVWRRARSGERRPLSGAERTLDRIALNALGVATEELREVLPRFDSFDDLLAWSQARAGGLDRLALARFEAVVAGAPAPPAVRQRIDAVEAAEPVLSEADLGFWDENGYVIVRSVITPDE